MPAKDKRIGIYGIYENEELLYIGQTKYFGRRVSQHKSDIKYRPSILSIDNYLSKCDLSSISFKLLKECDAKELNMYEEQFVDLYNPKFNINRGGKSHNFDNLDRSKFNRLLSKKVKCLELNKVYDSISLCNRELYKLGYKVCVKYAVHHSGMSGGLYFKLVD